MLEYFLFSILLVGVFTMVIEVIRLNRTLPDNNDGKDDQIQTETTENP